MDRASAQKVARKYLNGSDKKKFDILVDKLKDPSAVSKEDMMQGATELTEIFDRNDVLIMLKPCQDNNVVGFVPMQMGVFHKGQKVT